MSEEKVKFSAFLVQGLSTLSIAYMTTILGYIVAWPSYTVTNFMSNETVLSQPMTSTQVSLMGSIGNVAGMAGLPIAGYALDNFGRKYSAVLFGLPFVLVWAVLSISNNVIVVIAACSLCGIGFAGQAVCSVYIAEIVQDSIRGCLASTIVSGYFAGLLFSYFVGGLLSYHNVIYVHLALSILYILMVSLIKESPVYLVQKGRYEEAAKSVSFYRRLPTTSKEVQLIVDQIKKRMDPQIDKIMEDDKGADVAYKLVDGKPEGNLPKTQSPWKFLMKSASSKRALAVVLILMLANTCMGAIVFQVYAEPILMVAVPTMPSNLCSIFLAVAWFVATTACSLVVDKLGRKLLMTYSSIATGLFTLALGIQIQLNVAPPWFSMFLIYGYCFVNYFGAATVPFILVGEVFLPEISAICNSMAMGCLFIANFALLVSFYPFVELFTLGPLFYVFAIVAFSTALYSQLYLPETKGLSAYEIQKLFIKG